MEPTDLEDLAWWDEQLQCLEKRQPFEGPQFMRPHHFVALACEVHRCALAGLNIPDHLQEYAARMRLWQCLNLPSPKAVNERNPGGRFHPLSRITSERSAQDLADDIGEVFRAAGTTDATTLNAITGALSEIFSNCFFHAEAGSELCGLACAQSWPALSLAQVAVADTGIGVRTSLTSNPAYTERLQAENACEMATELYVTSKPDGPHGGYGLTLARQLMEKHGGNFLLASGREGFRATEHITEGQALLTPRRGTIVVLEWDTSKPLNVLNVYNSWPSDGDADELF